MLVQGLALARAGSIVAVLADLEHAALHWQEAGHHHHDDGSYHLDDSDASVQHLIVDQLSPTAALFATDKTGFCPGESTVPGGLREGPPPHPFIDGLLRPPRARS